MGTKSISLAPPVVDVERDGRDLLVSSGHRLGSYPENIATYVSQWAAACPSRLFLADRLGGAEWRTITYGVLGELVDAASQFFLNMGAQADRPVMLVGVNSLEHAVLSLGAMQVGIPIVPVSPDYLKSRAGLVRLAFIVDLTRPSVVFTDNADHEGHAFIQRCGAGVIVISRGRSSRRGRVHDFDAVIATPVTSEVLRRFRKVSRETLAKIMFTSGTTGMPKGVMTTHGMLCAQQQMMARLWQFLEVDPPILLDWLPWSHTSGGTNSFNMVLRNGGSLYVDDGRPTESGMAATVRNLRDVSPTWYTNVPLGYALLLRHLERDPSLPENLFRRLHMLVYGGASLSSALWRRLGQIGEQATGYQPLWACGWGMTETTSTAAVTHFPVAQSGIIGLPLPGMQFRLTPHEGGYRAWVKGPNVTPGYYQNPTATKAAFDADGYFDTGDLIAFFDESKPCRGLTFEGRLAEGFKLTSGTWIAPGGVRGRLLAAMGPMVKDAVIVGADRDFVVAGLWIDEAETADLLTSIAQGLDTYNAATSVPSHRVHHVFLLTDAPDPVRGELTQKGTINQARFVRNHADLIDRIYRSDFSGLRVVSAQICLGGTAQAASRG